MLEELTESVKEKQCLHVVLREASWVPVQAAKTRPGLFLFSCSPILHLTWSAWLPHGQMQDLVILSPGIPDSVILIPMVPLTLTSVFTIVATGWLKKTFYCLKPMPEQSSVVDTHNTSGATTEISQDHTLTVSK